MHSLPSSKQKTGKVSDLLARNTAQGFFWRPNWSLKVHCVRKSVFQSQSELFRIVCRDGDHPKVSVLDEFGTNLKYYLPYEVDL